MSSFATQNDKNTLNKIKISEKNQKKRQNLEKQKMASLRSIMNFLLFSFF
jgi:hypothetical protein